jgi:hypothetical protein
MRQEILTPGMKKRILAQLKTLTVMVKRDEHRDTITYRLAELMPWMTNEFSYYDPERWRKAQASLARTSSKTRGSGR